MTKNEMRYSQQAESSAIRFPIESRSSRIGGTRSMYTPWYRICIPMTNWRTANLRSALEYVFTNPHVPKNVVPLGFCCGGFSSTAGYAPATKLNFR